MAIHQVVDHQHRPLSDFEFGLENVGFNFYIYTAFAKVEPNLVRVHCVFL